jgi:diguanylate cyclase (GGDEF)-like protein
LLISAGAVADPAISIKISCVKAPLMTKKFFNNFFFGEECFDENEEYFKFSYHFLLVNMWFGVVVTALFILIEWLGLNTIGPPHIQMMQIFTTFGALLIIILRGRKDRFFPVALMYAVLCFIEHMSTLLFVPQDEFRLIWFYIYFAGVYIILGQKAGIIVTVLTIPGIIIANGYLAAPFSQNAMTTAVLSLLLTSLICYAYTSRSISFFRRMTDANDMLRVQAAVDPLTGVMNARAYYATTDRLIQVGLRSGSPFSVLFVDLDHFKSINDRYGHEAGDAVLRSVAASLTADIRQSDALGRIGGEEFSIFLPDTDLNQAEVLAEKLRKSIEALTPTVGDTQLKVTASIGVAGNRPDHRTIADIQRSADQAMYQAKKQGRNRVTCFEHSAAH